MYNCCTFFQNLYNRFAIRWNLVVCEKRVHDFNSLSYKYNTFFEIARDFKLWVLLESLQNPFESISEGFFVYICPEIVPMKVP